ncbi:MAG TPA: hypothetical protein VN493_08925 [Thermoanaerobaculia bacterium]|nr:hypothetical protein [Thermoanaerobaculia bacterium]
MAWFRQWRRPRQIDRKIRDGELDRALLSFYRCKTALLLLEGSMIVAGLSSLSSLTPAIHGVLRFGWFFGLFLAGLGLAVLTVSAVARVLRISRLSSPLVMISARYLLLTQAAFLAGAQGGLLWMEGREGELGLLIGYAGALCGMLAWLFFLPSVPSGSGIKNGAFWSVLFLALALLGIPIGLNDRFGGWPGRLLEAAALLTPLWSLLLFRKFGHWLPRPFLWRNLSDSRLPKRVRTSLMFLKWTAMLPGGGLAIPAWIALREVLEREFRRRKTLPL